MVVRSVKVRASRASLVIAVMAVLTLLTACGGGGGGSGSGGDSGPIVIGASLGLTGSYAVIGKEEAQGVQAAVDHVNKQGGVLGRQLELKVVDNQSDARVAAESVSRLVERDGARVLIVDGTPTAAAAIPVSRQLRVPLVSNGGGWPFGFTKPEDLHWAFGLLDLSGQLDNYVAFWKSRGITKVAGIGADTPLTNVVTDYFSKGRGKDSGIELTTFQKFPPGSADLSSYVANLRTSGAQAVLSWTTGPDQSTTLSTIRRLGVDLPVHLIGGTTGPAFVDVVGGPDALNGIYSQAWPSQLLSHLPDGDVKTEVQSYLDGMTQVNADTKGGTSLAISGWDAVRVVVDGIDAAKSTDPEAVRGALENLKTLTIIGGHAQRTPADHVGGTTGTITAVFDASAFRQDPNAGWKPVGPITAQDVN